MLGGFGVPTLADGLVAGINLLMDDPNLADETLLEKCDYCIDQPWYGRIFGFYGDSKATLPRAFAPSDPPLPGRSQL